MGGFEAAEDLGAGVTEGVVAANADDGVMGADGGQEGGVGGGAAAVVADFEQGGRGDASVFEHGGFAGCFGVAFKQDAGVIKVETEDEGVVVYRGAGVGVGEFGGKDGGVEIGPGEGFTGVEVADSDVLGVSLSEEGEEERGVAGVDAEPEFAGVEVVQDGGHAAHVVGVGVGEHDDVDVADVAGPEIGGDHLFADVPGAGGGVGTAAGGSSRVYEEGLARGADDEQGISLADVDGGDFQLAEVEGGRRGIEDGEWDEDGDEDACGEEEAATGSQRDDAEGDAGGRERDDDRRGARGAEVGEGGVLDAVHGETHEVQEERGKGGGEHGYPRADQRREEHEDRDAEEDGEQRDVDEVEGEGEQGEAVEVDGHGENHADFGGEGEEDGVEGQIDEAKEPDGKVAERASKEGEGEAAGHADFDTELGEGGVKEGVDAEGFEVIESTEMRVDEASAERNGEAGDGDDDEESHLEARFEEGSRIEDEDREGGGAEGVEGRDLAVEPAGDEVDRGHGEGTLAGNAEAGELSVGEGSEDGEDDGWAFGKADTSQEPEKPGGYQGDMQAGDDEEVEGSGALEGLAQGVGEMGAVAKEHGVEHGGVFGGEAGKVGEDAVGARIDEGL